MEISGGVSFRGGFCESRNFFALASLLCGFLLMEYARGRDLAPIWILQKL